MIQLTRKRENSLVGLEIEAESVAAVEVRTGGSTELLSTAVAPLPPGVFEDGEVVNTGALTEALKALFSDNKLGSRVRLGIANQRMVVRTMRLPAIDDPGELDAAVRFQAQEQIPMPIDQAVLDHRVVGGVPATADAPAQIDVVVIAARRDMIESSLAPLRDAGLKVVGVDLSAFGLIRALGGSHASLTGAENGGGNSSSSTLFCNISDVTNLAVAKGRSCLFTRISPFGLSDVVTNLSNAVGLTPEHAAMWLNHVGLDRPLESIEGDPGVIAETRAALEAGASSLHDELRLSLDFYGAQEGAVPVEHAVLCGPGSTVPGLAGQIEASVGLPFSVGRPAALAELDAASAARLTLPYGLALDE
ncbi:MAG TPA: type IV pilus assembly protein PilM [Solirubrobacterales bacterium]